MGAKGLPNVEAAITEQTRVPISLIIVAAGALIWLVRLEGRVDANATAGTRIEKKQDTYTEVVNKIDSRLSRIEGKLGIDAK